MELQQECTGTLKLREIPHWFRGLTDVDAFLPLCIANSDDAWFREFVLQWILCREDYLGRVRPPEAVRSLLALDEQWPVSIYMDEQVKIPAAVSALTGEMQTLLDALKASLESKSSDVQKGASL